MFDDLPTAPVDPIFGLTAAYLEDPHPEKINLGAGIYRDERGRTPILEVVKEAERRLWQEQDTKSYLPIEGDAGFDRRVERLLFGHIRPRLADAGFVTVQAPGGTGAIRLAADLLAEHRSGATVWIPDPTWVNHPQIMQAVGLSLRTYPYLDSSRRRLDLKRLLMTLTGLEPGDVVVLHGCCHNPSGIDPEVEQWAQIAEVLSDRQALPLVDLAYLGFGKGLAEDRRGIEILAESVPELMVCTSFSKNFALYNERVGALTVKTRADDARTAVLSQLQHAARVSFSNPPAHGAAIVSMILGSGEMENQWHSELASMRRRIHEMRRLFVDGLDARRARLAADGNAFLLDHNGMFSFTGLKPEQIRMLRERYSVYLVDSGRANFAGMTRASMDRLCDAVTAVL